LAASGSSGDTSQRLADSVSRAASERSRFNQEIAELRESLEESRSSQRELVNERLELRHALDERSTELDALRKRINREIPINAGLQEPYRNSRSSSPQSPSSKYELSMARDEITGLKCVIFPVIFVVRLQTLL
jgi:CAP-Gly domain-containing linker protein 1